MREMKSGFAGAVEALARVQYGDRLLEQRVDQNREQYELQLADVVSMVLALKVSGARAQGQWCSRSRSVVLALRVKHPHVQRSRSVVLALKVSGARAQGQWCSRSRSVVLALKVRPPRTVLVLMVSGARAQGQTHTHGARDQGQTPSAVSVCKVSSPWFLLSRSDPSVVPAPKVRPMVLALNITPAPGSKMVHQLLISFGIVLWGDE